MSVLKFFWVKLKHLLNNNECKAKEKDQESAEQESAVILWSNIRSKRHGKADIIVSMQKLVESRDTI